jgi:hypothetical protein
MITPQSIVCRYSHGCATCIALGSARTKRSGGRVEEFASRSFVTQYALREGGSWVGERNVLP